MTEWSDPLRKRTTTLDLGRKGKLVANVGTAEEFSSDGSEPIYESLRQSFEAEASDNG
jgi:hypothetical protein